MEQDYLSHVAAIGVGVGVTLLILVLAGTFSAKEAVAEPPASTSRAAASTTSKPKKNKQKNKKAAATSNGGDAPVETNPIEVEAEKEEPAPAAATASKKKKKNKANKQQQQQAKAVPVVEAAPKPTPKPQPKPQPAQVDEEEWGMVVSSKSKKNKARAGRPKPAPSAASNNSAGTDSILIDAKKIGIIIGPKGATLKALEEATGCKLDVNAPKKEDAAKKGQTAGIVMTGGDKAKAKLAITELATKGYATCLMKMQAQLQNSTGAPGSTAAAFMEQSLSVHPKYLSEIVGPRGATIQALQSGLDVKLTIPPTEWSPNSNAPSHMIQMCKVGIAGSNPANVKQCKTVIQTLIKWHHHPLTHPGQNVIHEEVYVPMEMFHCIIGPRGSEIKHIKGNYKVEVYMPSNDDMFENENVIVVGKKLNVDKAISHIQKLMDRDSAQRDQKYSDDYY